MTDEELLFKAVGEGWFLIVEELLNSGINPDAAHRGLTPLFLALKTKCVEMMKLLLDAGANPNTIGEYKFSPLSWAANKGHTELMECLLTAGAGINNRDGYGRTALCAAPLNNRADVVKFLLDAGANPNLADIQGRTPLFWASYRSQSEMVKLLLEAGANPNLADDHGQTSLFWASMDDDVEMVKLLLNAGADPAVVDNLGNAPISEAKCIKTKELLTSYPKVPTLRTLCLRTVREKQIDHQFIPPVVFEHPDEVEEEQAYRKRQRDFEENNPNKRR